MPRYMTIHDLNNRKAEVAFIDHVLTEAHVVRPAYYLHNADSTLTYLRRLGIYAIIAIQIALLGLEVFFFNGWFTTLLSVMLRAFWLLWATWAMGRMELVGSAVRFLRLRLTRRRLHGFLYAMIALHVVSFAGVLLSIIWFPTKLKVVVAVAGWWEYWWSLRAIICIVGSLYAWGAEENVPYV